VVIAIVETGLAVLAPSGREQLSSKAFLMTTALQQGDLKQHNMNVTEKEV
jgi:hypothetical protein